MQLRVIDEADVTPDLDRRIRAGLCTCFPKDVAVFTHTRQWHGTGPAFSVIMEDADFIAAHVGIVDRAITVGEQPLRVAGIQNVFVLPAYRGRGLGDQVLQAGLDEAQRRGFDAGLLFCTAKLIPVYARSGWQLIDERATLRVDEAQREVPLPPDNRAMYHPLRLRTFPSGAIHLRGNDW